MKLRLWLRRIKGFNRKGLHCRRSKHFLASKPITAKPTFLITKSPVFVSGNLSLPCLPPALSHKAPQYIAHQSMLSLSPLSPSPSPAITTTPTGHNTPLALKDLLGFEAVDCNQRPPPPPLPNTFACIAATLGCCQARSPRVDNTHIMQLADHGKRNHWNASKLRPEHGRLQESTTKWTGMCKCMLVRVEKRSVTTHADAHSKPRGTYRGATGTSHRKHRHSMQDRCADRANTSIDSNACIDIEHAPSRSSSADVCRKPSRTSTLDRRKTLAEASLSMDRDGRRSPSVKKPPNGYTSWCTLPKQRLSVRAAEAHTTEQNCYVVKAAPSMRSSLPKTDKLRNRGDIHDAENAHTGEPLVYRWTTHQEQENRSGRLATSNSAKQAVDVDNLSGLGSDEESSLLQVADSYDSSETFSISSHSPWLNEPTCFVASSSGPVDLEAHARPWIATENFVSISKSALNHDKSRGGAPGRRYKSAFAQRAGSVSMHRSKADTIVLPSEMSNASVLSPANACNAVNGGIRGGLVVEKRSRDPYVDFTDSMLDMILQNHICSSKDLEGLLQCFLSLNSVEHHDVIVQAFVEVWENVVVGRSRVGVPNRITWC